MIENVFHKVEKNISTDFPDDTSHLQFLQQKSNELYELEKDVKIVADEMSRRSGFENIICCVDFDVVYSASDWTDSSNKNHLWASFLFYFDNITHNILPGTLYEIYQFLEKRQYRTNQRKVKIGNLGKQLIKAVENLELGNSLIDLYPSAQMEYKRTSSKSRSKSRTSQLLYIFDLLKEKFELVPLTDIGNLDRRRFNSCAEILSNTHRHEKIVNNRVDSLNYTVISQLCSIETDNQYVLISDTSAIFQIHSALSLNRIEHQNHGNVTVWNSRVASIFFLVWSAARSERNAKKIIWDLYQYLIDSRRAIEYEIDRVKEGRLPLKGSMNILGNNTFFTVISNFQSLQASFNHLHQEHIYFRELLLENSSNIDHKLLFQQITDFLKTKFNYEDKNFHFKLVNKGEQSIGEVVEVHDNKEKFGYLHRYDIKSESSKKMDTILHYDNCIQLIVESEAPLLEFLDVVNKVRSRIRKKLITDEYNYPRPDEDTGRLITVTKDNNEFDSGIIDFDWAELVYGARGNYYNNDTGETHTPSIMDIQRLIEEAPERVDFLRFQAEYCDVSYEGVLKVITTKYPINDELLYFFERLSSFAFKNREEIISVINNNNLQGKHNEKN